jgi:hypothetical protein
MAVEEEFTEYHKDSFSFGKPEKEDKKKPAAATPPASPAPKSKEGNFDDYVPEKVGEVVDNVFGKLDNLVNDAADYLFGGKKKSNLLDKTPPSNAAIQVPPLKPQEQPPLTPKAPPSTPQKAAPPRVPTPQQAPTQRTAPPPPKAPPQIRKLSTLQGSRQPEMIRPVMPESATKHDGPVISRTTSISELEELPLELLNDPDLSRYFDQMKLYESKVVKGGLCNLPQYEAISYLKKGYWGGDFNIRFEDLKRINPGIYPMEMARSRFGGMRPVYKAQGFQFGGKEKLIRAIETDINLYLLGKNVKKDDSPFHPYIYQVVSTVIK